MEASAPEYFSRRVAVYDSLMRRAVPRYEEMSDRQDEYLPPARARILELGCGTGNLSLRLAARYPEAELYLVDASPEMLAVASDRLEQQGIGPPGRVRTLECSFEELDLPSAAFDLVASCIALHHVSDKGALLRRAFEALEPGGEISIADQMAGGTGASSTINWERWLEFCRAAEPCSEEEIDSLIEHARAHDHYTAVFEHMRLLEAAGFRSIDCVWRNWMWGVVTAVRP